MAQLAVEQRDLGSEQQIRPLIALSCLDEEEGFHIAQDGEAHFHARLRIESAERRHTDFKRTLLEGNVRGLCERARCRHAEDGSGCIFAAVGQLPRRSLSEEGAGGLCRLALLCLALCRLLSRLSRLSRHALQTELRLLDRAKRQQGESRVVDSRVRQRALQAEVEVDADSLEEPVRDCDEANFDRDLQILQSSQLIEQVGNLLMNLLSLSDDEAQCRFVVPHRGLAADRVPTVGSERRD